MDVCNQHELVKDCIRKNESTLNELKTQGAVHITKLENLTEDVKGLVTTVRVFMFGTISILLGFFVWYVQSIPN